MRPAVILTFVFVCAVGILLFVDPSFAQRNNPAPSGAPAPLLGLIGLPVAGLVLAAAWLARRLGRD